MEVIQSTFADHNDIKLDSNNRDKIIYGKSSNIWKKLLNNQWIIGKDQGKLEHILTEIKCKL